MDIGMMWFDNDPKTTLDVKVQHAADYYQHKYGRKPNLCFVNPLSYAKGQPQAETARPGSILIQPFRAVLPDHLWIGLEEKLPALDAH